MNDNKKLAIALWLRVSLHDHFDILKRIFRNVHIFLVEQTTWW